MAWRKSQKRAAAAAAEGPEHVFHLKPAVAEQLSSFSTTATPFNAWEMPVSNGGAYLGRHSCKKGEVWALEKLLEAGFSVIHWNGRCMVESH